MKNWNKKHGEITSVHFPVWGIKWSWALKQRRSCPDSSGTKSAFLWNWAFISSQTSDPFSPGRSLPFFRIWRGSQGAGAFLVDVQCVNLGPLDGQENTRSQQTTSPIQTRPWWLDAPWKCAFEGWGRENPMSGTTGCWVCFYSTFYSTLFPLETPFAPWALQPRCWDWDMGAALGPLNQQVIKSSLFKQLKNK